MFQLKIIIYIIRSKEDHNKAIGRFEKKIQNIANLPTKFNAAENEEDHLDTLNKFPPIFVRMVIFNLVNELDISYKMSEGMAYHSVACYAQGYNDDGLKYTVLSWNSYFYAYNLDNGYVSFKFKQ